MMLKKTWAVLALSMLVSAVLIGQALAGPDSDSRRMDKQIRVFERVMDDMLVESPNWLVRNVESTRGTYIEGHGAVFSFKVDLNDHRWHDNDRGFWSWFHNDDSQVIVIRDDDRDSKKHKKYEDELLPRQEKLYRRGKEEIVETLVDFGDILSAVDDSDWLEIKVRLKRADYFKENDIRKLTMKVKMSDLRAYSQGTLDEDDLVDRISVNES